MLLAGLDQWLDTVGGAGHQVAQVHLAAPELDAAGLQTRDLQQVLDQAGQLVGGQVDVGQQAVQSGRHVRRLVVEHDTDGGFDGGDRCPQIMRHAREELVALAFELLARGLEALALDGVPHRAHEQPAVDATLDEVVLGAGLHRANRRLLVVQAAEHHDRHVGRAGVRPLEGPKATAIREGQVEQDHLSRALG